MPSEKYTILSAIAPERLIALVESYVAKGWQVSGGVSVTMSPQGFATFYQALTFKEN